MMRDIFDPLFDLQDTRLAQLGNPFVELDRCVDWEAFRALLEQTHAKERKSNAGAHAKDVVMMFKGLVIQNLYGLSDDQLEYQIEDRRSFQHFLGLNKHQRSPDAKTFWAFRNRLTELKLIEALFEQFSRQLNKAGYIARKGQIIDATVVSVPIQRNKKEENKKIKDGDVPEDWSDNKRRQKDTQARWGMKHGKSHFGYKNHIEVDNAHKLIRKYATTDARIHDSNVFDELLDSSNTNKDVWADTAYRSKKKEGSLKEKNYRSKIHRSGHPNKPLTTLEKRGNRTRSRTRCRVEHVFGAQSDLRAKAMRCIGLARSCTEIGMMNLVYNMRRFCFLKRVSTP